MGIPVETGRLSRHRFQDRGQASPALTQHQDFALRYPAVAAELAKLPDDTAIDGEVVAFDEEGRPFNALQNSPALVVFYVFDVMVLAGTDVMSEPLDRRQALLEKRVLRKLKEPVGYTGALNAGLADLIASVKTQG